MRALRALGLVTLLALSAGAALALAVSRAVDLPAARTTLEDAVRARTGGALRMDAIRVGWLPPRLVLERPAFAPAAPAASPLLGADRVTLRLAPLALLRGAPVAAAIRHVSVSGQPIRGEGDVAPDGALALDLVLDGLDAAALAPALAGLRLGVGDGGPSARIASGRASGTVHVAGVPGGALALDLALVLDDADAVVEGATVRGRIGLRLALVDAPGAPWSGHFDADVGDASVERGPLRKAAGRPTRVSGELALGEGGNVAIRALKIAPLALDLSLGGGPPIEIQIGGGRDAAEAP